MKRMNVMMLIALLMTLGITSCKKDNPNVEGEQGEVQFTSSIIGQLQGRMTGSAFEVEDAIGVFMHPAGSTLSNATATNRRYIFGSSGTFTAQNAEERIFYPEQGEVDFTAYYPYQDGATARYAINVANQSNLGDIDLLYARIAGVNGAASTVPSLPFRHELSKVIFNISGQNINLNGLAVRFNNINTTANFDLATGQISGNGGAANVSARVNANGTLAEAILLPGEMGGQSVTFTLGDATYTWTMPAGAVYAPATRYTYAITLVGSEEGLTEVTLGQSTITDWTEGAGTSQTLTADEGGNGGTEPVGPGTETLLYEETFGATATVTTALIGNYTGYTAAGFLNGTITYSNVGAETGFGDIRSTSSINPNLWLPANRQVTFQGAGIDAANATNLRLEFDIAANNANNGNTQNANNDIITVNFNGTNYRLSPVTFTANNAYSPVSIQLSTAGTASSTLQFVSTYDATAATGNTVGVRVDNVRLYGTR
ncbi:fimbrillin family protein [Sphingobacterium oryzagri]|uniref:Fimbrillin family protein n=1 Tax=Sphingobacterium oryzagri TaxID=3025669 RepID=A0ABY7WD43_9SPHI|nr:fimbrillin family protein [Sphingobacterium sp. KACC 22765]WDF67576.1 fimbrillin family protein [Sphingobacterium sp. KACC 22765]